MPTFDTPEPIDIQLDLVVGNIRITATDRTDTVAEVRPTNEADESDVRAAEQTRLSFADGTLSVVTPKVRAMLNWSNKTRSIDVLLEVPTGSRVHGSASVAEFHATGRLAGCEFKTSVGSIRLQQAGPVNLKTVGTITVDRVTGAAEVSNGSGDIRLGVVDGTADIKNSNGATEIGEVTGAARLRASNGEIVVGRAGASVDAKAANGAVRLNEVVTGEVVAESGMGDVEVRIAQGTAARLDVETKFGRVHRALEATDGPASTDRAVTVRGRTGFGDITIARS